MVQAYAHASDVTSEKFLLWAHQVTMYPLTLEDSQMAKVDFMLLAKETMPF